jgi:RNA polymerase sigma factor (sigma-70 family)
MTTPTFEMLHGPEGRARVQRTLRACGIGAQTQEDLTQDVYLSVHRRLSQTSVPVLRDPWLWIAGIAYNVARDHLRRVRRQEQRLDRDADPDSLADPFDAAERRQRTQFALILDLLPQIRDARVRDVMLRLLVEGQSLVEIAREVGRPLPTVKAQALRGRHALRRALRRYTRAWSAETPRGVR